MQRLRGGKAVTRTAGMVTSNAITDVVSQFKNRLLQLTEEVEQAKEEAEERGQFTGAKELGAEKRAYENVLSLMNIYFEGDTPCKSNGQEQNHRVGRAQTKRVIAFGCRQIGKRAALRLLTENPDLGGPLKKH
jgi:hypothetical protein